MRSPVIFQVLLAGTALAVPHYDPGHHLQHEKRAAARGMQAIPEMEGVRRTASGALSMALMNEVDLDLFRETVETVQGYTENLQDVIRMYSQKAEASQTLEEVTQAIDAEQLTADIAAPLSHINDALYTGISRMMMSSARRPGRGGFRGLENIVGAYGQTTQLLTVIIIIIQIVSGLQGLDGGNGTGLDLLSGLLAGLLGDNSNLLSPGVLSGDSGIDTITSLLNSLLGLTNAFVPVDGVTTNLTPVIGI